MSVAINFSAEELEDMFEFLDELRASGETNMWGAAPYVQEAFDIDRRLARNVAMAWMATFDPDMTPAARVAKAREA